MTLGPLSVMIALGSCAVVFKERGHTKHSHDCITGVLLICFLVAPATSIVCFRTFHCDTLDDGQQYLIAVSGEGASQPSMHLSDTDVPCTRVGPLA